MKVETTEDHQAEKFILSIEDDNLDEDHGPYGSRPDDTPSAEIVINIRPPESKLDTSQAGALLAFIEAFLQDTEFTNHYCDKCDHAPVLKFLPDDLGGYPPTIWCPFCSTALESLDDLEEA